MRRERFLIQCRAGDEPDKFIDVAGQESGKLAGFRIEDDGHLTQTALA